MVFFCRKKQERDKINILTFPEIKQRPRQIYRKLSQLRKSGIIGEINTSTSEKGQESYEKDEE